MPIYFHFCTGTRQKQNTINPAISGINTVTFTDIPMPTDSPASAVRRTARPLRGVSSPVLSNARVTIPTIKLMLSV
ncbi:MAG: hypothetical protein K1W26_18890 [Acetatifactor sp.]